MAQKSRSTRSNLSATPMLETVTTPEPSSTPTTKSTTAGSHTKSAPSIVWVQVRSKYKPFDIDVKTDDGRVQVMEYKVKGTVASAFLKLTRYNHTLMLNIEPTEIDKLKELVKTCPAFNPTEEFRWPFTGTEAKFTNREDIEQEFKHIWDGCNMMALKDVDERKQISSWDIDVRNKVVVKYIVIPYLGRKAGKDDEGFSAGCSLELLSIGLLNSDAGGSGDGSLQFDFNSPSKKRRTR